MNSVLRDVRYSLRSFRRKLLFSSIAILTLAVGIGANTAIFSVVNAALLRPLPFDQPDRLVKIGLTLPANGDRPAVRDMVFSYPKYEVLRNEQRVFAQIGGYSRNQVTLSGGGDPERVDAELAIGDYLTLLGIRPRIGRTFTREEDRDPGKASVVLISEGLWNRRFNAAPNAVGSTLIIDGEPKTIVGVLPASFRGLGGQAEVWQPAASMGQQMMTEVYSHFMEVVARLDPAVTMQRAAADVEMLGKRIDAVYAPMHNENHWGAALQPLEELRIDPNIRRSVLVLFVAVAGVLLIACANVANLLLARATDRRREIAVRLALGAGRGRLVRQLLTEAVTLGLTGGILGIALGAIGVRGLAALAAHATGVLGRQASGLTAVSLAAIRIDGTVLAFTLIASVLTGLLFGLVPALQATRLNLTVDLKSGGNTIGFGGVRGFTSRSILVSAEIGVAFVLLVASGLMLKSLSRLLDTGAGVDPHNLMTVRITIPASYTDRNAFWEQLLPGLATLPGVQSAGLTDCPPLSGGCNGTILWYRDRPPVAEGSEPSVGIHWVTPEYFGTVRLPVMRGRNFSANDREGSPKVVIINETAARKLFPGENPLGRRIGVGQGGFAQGAEIIGVVADQRFRTMEAPPEPDVYIAYAQSPRPRAIIFLRTSVQPTAVLSGVRREVRRIDPNLAVYDAATMEERVGNATARTRVTGILLALFAGVALVLSLVGIYGVVAYAVTQRTREIGLRIALGAERSAVAGMVLRYGGALVAIGLVVGLLGAFAATRVLRSLLYEVQPTDPTTFGVLTVLTGLVALAGTAAPAWRATRVDPLTALKSE